MRQATWAIARDVARRTLAGDLETGSGAHELWSLWPFHDAVPELGELVEPLGSSDPDNPAALRAEMRRISEAILRAG